MVEHPHIVLWDIGSISYGGHITLLLNDWYNKGHDMCYPFLLIKTISFYAGDTRFLLKSLIFYDISNYKVLSLISK